MYIKSFDIKGNSKFTINFESPFISKDFFQIKIELSRYEHALRLFLKVTIYVLYLYRTYCICLFFESHEIFENSVNMLLFY